MLDTLVLTFDEMDFHVEKGEMFSPPYSLLRRRRALGDKLAYIPFVNNPTKEELARGEYRPRLTVKAVFIKGRWQNMLRVEFSVPKLLFGNNLQEPTEGDLPALIKKLSASIRAAGVFIPIRKFRRSRVSAIHYSKNFVFTDGSIPAMQLAELRRCNISQRLGFGETTYRNGGRGLKWHCKSYELAFYDKLAEMSQSRAVGECIEVFRRKSRSPYEILRLEVRLNKRPKIRQALENVGEEPGKMTLAQLFLGRVAKAVLLHHIHELEASYPAICPDDAVANAHRLFGQLAMDNPTATPRNLLAFVGLSTLFKGFNHRELKAVLGPVRARAWNKTTGDFKKLKTKAQRPSVFRALERQLADFRPLKEVAFLANIDSIETEARTL